MKRIEGSALLDRPSIIAAIMMMFSARGTSTISLMYNIICGECRDVLGGCVMRYRRREILRLTLANAALVAVPRLVHAQAWPSKPIRAVIPIAAGSSIDIISRIVFEPLSKQLGQPIIMDNRPGAGTTIGSAAVARADPDGYTFLVNSSAHAATPAIYPNAPYDTLRDFAAVASLGSSPNVTVISPAK